MMSRSVGTGRNNEYHLLRSRLNLARGCGVTTDA